MSSRLYIRMQSGGPRSLPRPPSCSPSWLTLNLLGMGESQVSAAKARLPKQQLPSPHYALGCLRCVPATAKARRPPEHKAASHWLARYPISSRNLRCQAAARLPQDQTRRREVRVLRSSRISLQPMGADLRGLEPS